MINTSNIRVNRNSKLFQWDNYCICMLAFPTIFLSGDLCTSRNIPAKLIIISEVILKRQRTFTIIVIWRN